MTLNFWKGAALAGCCLLGAGVSAMNHNLARPWDDKSSPPKTPYLAFSFPGHGDVPVFESGKKIRIRVQSGLRSVALDWTLARNRVNTPFLKGRLEELPGGIYYIEIPTGKLLPGFYDLAVTLDTGMPKNRVRDPLGKRPVSSVCTFGWKLDEMPVTETRPADFKAFWDKARAEIRAIKPDPRDETAKVVYDKKGIEKYNVESACLPPDYDSKGHKTETVESWKVSFAGPDGGRVYGWLAKPQGPGPFPAMLVLPGAGFAARPRPLEHARHGFLALDIQVHGQDVDLVGKYPEAPGYYRDFDFSSPEKYYYYNVHKRVMQALDYLANRPDVDPKRIVVVGGSQGGRLSVVAAGLDNRIAAAIPCISHSANWPRHFWVSRCNRTKSDGMDLTSAPPAVDTPEGKTMAYYDPMNYAPDIQCPVLFNAGLVDPVSPASSVWASYLRVGVNKPDTGLFGLGGKEIDKAIVWLPGMGHDWSAGFDRYAWRWLEKKLGARK